MTVRVWNILLIILLADSVNASCGSILIEGSVTQNGEQMVLTQIATEKLSALNQTLKSPEASVVSVMGISWEEITNVVELIGSARIDKVAFSIEKTSISTIKRSSDVVQFNEVFNDDAINLLEHSFDDARNGRMGFLSFSEAENDINVLRKSSKSGRTFRIEHNGNSIGILLFRDFELEGKTKTLVSWVWLAENSNLNLEFQGLASEILANEARSEIVAAIHYKNKRSLGFFKRLGFVPHLIFVKKEG